MEWVENQIQYVVILRINQSQNRGTKNTSNINATFVVNSSRKLNKSSGIETEDVASSVTGLLQTE